MKKNIALLLIVFTLLILLTAGFWLYEAKYFVSNARPVAGPFSLENSYLFVSPLKAKADSQEKIRVTVFVLNSQGLGVGGYKVTLDKNSNLTLYTIQGLTDGYGKAVFDLTASLGGEYYLSVYVGGKRLSQQAHLSFY